MRTGHPGAIGKRSPAGSHALIAEIKDWRRGRDSNPRYPLRYVRFRGGSFQPLTHLSAPDTILPYVLIVLSLTCDSHLSQQSAAATLTNVSNQLASFFATAFKKRLQQFSTAAGQHATADFRSMVQLRVIQHLQHRVDCTCFGIIRAINDAFHPRVHQRARAHRARLNCNKELTVSKTMITQVRSGLAKGNDFGVGGGIGVNDVAVPTSANNFSRVNNDGAYGNLTRF